MIPKAPFLISPAYSVPPMMISWRDRWTRMAVSLRVPSALRVGAERRRVDDREVGLEAVQVVRRPAG